MGDMRVWGTYGCGGHEGVGDLYSGGLVCLIRPSSTVVGMLGNIFYDL